MLTERGIRAPGPISGLGAVFRPLPGAVVSPKTAGSTAGLARPIRCGIMKSIL